MVITNINAIPNIPGNWSFIESKNDSARSSLSIAANLSEISRSVLPDSLSSLITDASSGLHMTVTPIPFPPKGGKSYAL